MRDVSSHALEGKRPVVHASAWVAPGVVLVGDVTLEADSSVWYGCVLRGDLAPIRIGRESNVQDLTVIHVDIDRPAEIGERVTVGHRVILHGCHIGDDVLIGMGAIVLSGARIGKGCLVAAGAVVREGFDLPPGTVAAGTPATVRGPVGPELRARIEHGARSYVDSARLYRRELER